MSQMNTVHYPVGEPHPQVTVYQAYPMFTPGPPGPVPMMWIHNNQIPAGHPQWLQNTGQQPQIWRQNNEGQDHGQSQSQDQSQPPMWMNNNIMEELPTANPDTGPPPEDCFQYSTVTEIQRNAPTEPIGSSVSDYLIYLFESGNYSDMIFHLVEHGVTVPAHSLLLAARSEQFRQFFLENKSFPVLIPVEDTTVEIFKLFLQCFYSDNVEFSSSAIAVEILRLAYRFDVRSLIARCAASIRDSIHIGSVWSIFQIACECDQQDLKYWCLEFISQNASTALKDDNFGKLSLEKVLIVVSHDTLRVPEIEIFQAVLRWADTNARRRKIPVSLRGRLNLIAPLLPYIRFALMSTKDLKRIVRPTGVLNPIDYGDIFIYVDEREKRKGHVNKNLRFDTTPRGQTNYIAKMYGESCHQESSTYLSSNGEKDVFMEEFRFQCDLHIYMSGICLYGPGFQDRLKNHLVSVDYDVTIRIMGENRQQNFFTTYEFKKNASQDFEVIFPSHYPIFKGCMYTVVVEISGYRARFGRNKISTQAMKLSGGRFATVTFHNRKDVTVFSHSGICRGLIFTMSSNYN